MVEVNNPPQPINTPISNDVNHESRVSLVLNGSGSTSQNPISGSNWVDADSVFESGSGLLNLSTTKGAAFRLKFGMAHESEVLTSASVSVIDLSGSSVSSIQIKSKFIKDSANNVFYADLYAGSAEDLNSATDSTRLFVDIKTSLGRKIRQQIYTQDLLDTTVLINGTKSTLSVPVEIHYAVLSGQTIYVPISFFAGWNDEMGRQHGQGDAALKGPVRKPYGGMETVEIFSFTGHFLVQAEQPIREATFLEVAPFGNTTYSYFFLFRSKKGSSEGVGVYASMVLTDCEDVIISDECPELHDPSTANLIDTTNNTITLEEVHAGSTGGNTNTDVFVKVTGYNGGVVQGATNSAVADIPIAGSIGHVQGISSSPWTISLTGAHETASLILAEVYNTNETNDGIGTVKGNTVVFRKGSTDDGFPAPPTISTNSFDFTASTEHYSFNLTSLGAVGATITMTLVPYDAGIDTTSATQATSDLGVLDFGAAQTATFTTIGSKTFSWVGSLPDAVSAFFTSDNSQVGATTTNSSGDILRYKRSIISSTIYTGPTITTHSSGLANGRINFTITDDGGQSAVFYGAYAITPLGAGTTYTSDPSAVTVTSGTGDRIFGIPAADNNRTGPHSFWLVGLQGRSNVITYYVGS